MGEGEYVVRHMDKFLDEKVWTFSNENAALKFSATISRFPVSKWVDVFDHNGMIIWSNYGPRSGNGPGKGV